MLKIHSFTISLKFTMNFFCRFQRNERNYLQFHENITIQNHNCTITSGCFTFLHWFNTIRTNVTFEFRNKSLISCGISNEHRKKNPVNLFFLSSFSTLWCYCLLFWTKKIVHLCVALCKLSYQTLAHRLTGTFSL